MFRFFVGVFIGVFVLVGFSAWGNNRGTSRF